MTDTQEFNEQFAVELPPEEEQPKKTKKKIRRRRRRARPLLGFLVFCLLLYGGYRFLMSDFFTVRSIEVEGNHYLTQAQVIGASGLEPGWNLFTTKTVPAKAALLEDPYIKLVDIRKQPRDTIVIRIDEREDYAAVPYGEDYIIIDSEGFVLRVTDIEPILPLLEGMTVRDMTPGSALQTEEMYLLTDTLDLLSVVDDHDIYFKRINFSTVVVKAYIYDQLYCEGTPSNIKANMTNISLLVQQLYNEDITKGVIKVGKNSYLSYSPQIE